MPLAVYEVHELDAELSEAVDKLLGKKVEDMTDVELEARAGARTFGENYLARFPGNPIIRASSISLMDGYYCGFLAAKGC